MADKGTPEDGPSLEMPSLPFKRRKRHDATTEDAGSSPSSPPPPAPAPAEPVRPSAAPVPKAQPSRAEQPATPPPQAEQTRVVRPAPVPQRSIPVARDPDLGDRAVVTPDRGDQHDEARPARRLPLPGLSGVTAALATGAVVGALGVLLVWLASVGCDAARGTASCGDGPGFLVLVAILAVLAYLGSVLLRAFGVHDAGSTSLLAVGVMAVLLMVFFADALFAWWMVLVVPIVSALAHALAWWVTTRVVQEDEPSPTRL